MSIFNICRMRFLFSLFILTCVFCSCTSTSSRERKVNDAIKTLSSVALMEEKGFALDNDSLLTEPISVFEENNIDSCLAEAYYLRGMILGRHYYIFRASDDLSLSARLLNELLYGDDAEILSVNAKYKYSRILFSVYMEQTRLARINVMHDIADSCMNNAESVLDGIYNPVLYARFMHEKALCYQMKNDNVNAKSCFEKAASVSEPDKSDCYRHLAEIFIKEGNGDSAVYFINKSIITNSRPEICSELETIKGMAYTKLGIPDSAIFYIEKNLGSVNKSLKVEALLSMFEMFDRLSLKEQSLNYVRRYISALEILKNDKRDVFFDKIQSLHEYKIQKDRATKAEFDAASGKILLYRLVFWALMFISLLLVYVYYNSRKKRKLKEQLKRESYIKVQETLKRKEMEIELSKKQEELRLKEIEKLNKSLDYYKQLNNITLPIIMSRGNNQGSLHLNDDDWSIIIKNADACFENFSIRLKEFCPELTNDDIRFCCLVKMELPLSLLSEIYHIAKPSISRRKMRLKEKMGIENTTFDEFISVF